MFKFDNNPTIGFLDIRASTCDPRDQKWHDIQQAKLGLSSARPLMEEYKMGLDPRGQEYHDVNMHLNRVGYSTLEAVFPKFDPVDVQSNFLPPSTKFEFYPKPAALFSNTFDPMPKKFVP